MSIDGISRLFVTTVVRPRSGTGTADAGPGAGVPALARSGEISAPEQPPYLAEVGRREIRFAPEATGALLDGFFSRRCERMA